MRAHETRGGTGLRREVLIPVPLHRRASALVGLSVVLVLLASAVDAVVWTYQTQRRLWRDSPGSMLRPTVEPVGRAAGAPVERPFCSRGLLDQ